MLEWTVRRGGSSIVDNVTDGGSPITLYWRPGCPYCASLRHRLRRLGVVTTEVNIWKDPLAAAVVRRVAGGNETVPTVIIGDTSLVNPTASSVVELAGRLAPGAVDPDRSASPGGAGWPGARVAQWVVICAVVAASFAADLTGHATFSWALDAVAVAAYLSFRFARRTT